MAVKFLGCGGAIVSRNMTDAKSFLPSRVIRSSDTNSTLPSMAIPDSTRLRATAATAAAVGGFVEWYDFFLSATAAALVWPFIFFPSNMSSELALVISVLSYVVAYFSRPIGAFIFGHMGDRRGRRTPLLLTMMIMGLSMLGIALIPDYSVIGAGAVLLLFLLRILFGIGVGGEFGGAASLLSELAAKSKWRGFWTSWAQIPLNLGVNASSIAFALAVGNLSRSNFLGWGWRVLFGVGSLILVVGFLIRYKLIETPLFNQLLASKKVVKSPTMEVLRKQWKQVMLLAIIYMPLAAGSTLIATPYSVSYLTARGVDASFAALQGSYTFLFGIPLSVASGMLADRFGRKRLMLLGSGLAAISMIGLVTLFTTLNPTLIIIARVFTSAMSLMSPVLAVAMAEQFPTVYRYSGAGLSFQMGGLLAGIITATIPTFVLLRFGGIVAAWPYLVSVTMIAFFIGFVSIFGLKETKGQELRQTL